MSTRRIFGASGLLLGAFLAVWLCFPRLRPWFEAPKYRILRWEERFPGAVRPGDEAGAHNE